MEENNNSNPNQDNADDIINLTESFHTNNNNISILNNSINNSNHSHHSENNANDNDNINLTHNSIHTANTEQPKTSFNIDDTSLKSFNCIIGHMKITYLNKNSKCFEEKDTLALLVDSYISLIPLHSIDDETISNKTTLFKYMPTTLNPKDSQLTSNCIVNQRSKKCIQVKDLKEPNDIPARYYNNSAWGLVPLRNTIGQTLFELNAAEKNYFTLSSMNEFIANKTNIHQFQLMLLSNNDIDSNSNMNTYNNTLTGYHTKVIHFYSEYYYDKDKNKYYFLSEAFDTALYSNAPGFFIGNAFNVLGICYEDNIYTYDTFIELFANASDASIDAIKHKFTHAKQKPIVISPTHFNDEDAQYYKSLLNFIYRENNSFNNKETFSLTEYNDVLAFCFNNAIPNGTSSNIKPISFWKTFFLTSHNLIERFNLSSPNQINLDPDLLLRQIMTYVDDSCELTELNFSNMKHVFPAQHYDRLFTSLIYSFTPRIQFINLHGCTLNMNNTINLCHLIHRNVHSLKKIILTNTNLTYASLYILTLTLTQKCSNIEEVDLSYNNFKLSDTAQNVPLFFAKIKKEDEFHKKDLDFIDRLFNIPQLKILRLGYIKNAFINRAFLQTRLETYKQLDINNIQLRYIDLSKTDLSYNETMDDFCQVITYIKRSLQSIVLKSCKINDETFSILTEFIIEHKMNLIHIDVSCNELTEQSHSTINDLFRYYSQLNEQDVTNVNEVYVFSFNDNTQLNERDVHSQVELGSMVRDMRFKRKTILELANTGVNKDTLVAFANCLKNYQDIKLMQLNLARNDIDDDMINESEFIKIVNRIKMMKVLYLQGNDEVGRLSLERVKEGKENEMVVVCDEIDKSEEIDVGVLKYVKFVKKKNKKEKKRDKQ